MRSNVLLLQGPVGPFFKWFSQDLASSGFNVFKINFNGGDRHFYHSDQTYSFTGYFSDWEEYLEAFLSTHNIGRIYLFGDCRAYHKVARLVANRNDIRLFVFEEGYIRPNFVTLEESGVNGNSSIFSKEIDFDNSVSPKESTRRFPIHGFRQMALQAVRYYLSSALYSYKFPNYVHHRPLDPISEGAKWGVSALRKVKYAMTERRQLKFLTENLHQKYFLCPLQVHCDMQISAHSNFKSVEKFIETVIASFSEHANYQHHLVFKHHPMDRGYKNYKQMIERLAYEQGLGSRIHYLHDQDLPSLLKSARGSVLINSTVGMSSLHHGTPVKTLGRAIYDRPELTSQDTLDEFWNNEGEVDHDAYIAFKNYLIVKNQLNGSFYQNMSVDFQGTGLVWSQEMKHEHMFHPDRIDPTKPPILRVVPRTATSVELPADDSSSDSRKLAS